MKIALRKYKQRPTLLDEADFTVVESHQNYNYIELLPVLVSLDASYLKCCKKGSKHTSYKSFVMTPSGRGLYIYVYVCIYIHDRDENDIYNSH